MSVGRVIATARRRNGRGRAATTATVRKEFNKFGTFIKRRFIFANRTRTRHVQQRSTIYTGTCAPYGSCTGAGGVFRNFTSSGFPMTGFLGGSVRAQML